MNKKLIVAILSLIALAGLAFGFSRWQQARQQQARQAAELPAVAVQRGPLQATVAATGRVISNLDVEIKSKASGEIIRLPFDIGDRVQKGTLLAELNPIDEQRQVQRASVNLSASRARLTQAGQNLQLGRANLGTDTRQAQAQAGAAEARASDARAKATRLRELLERKLASREEHETAETAAIQAAAEARVARLQVEETRHQQLQVGTRSGDVKLAEAQVELDRLTLSDAQQRLRDTRIFSPLSGIVTERKVQTGQIISSGISNVGGGTALLIVSDLSRLFVLAAVDESLIGKVRKGQKAILTADAYPGDRFEGTVIRLATRGVNVSNVVTFEVRIEVLGQNKDLLKPEMTVNVAVVTDRKTSTLFVPTAAIREERGQKTALVVGPDGSQEKRQVQTGLSTDTQIEIRSGLRAGEKVLLQQAEAQSRWRREGANRRLGVQHMLPGGGGRRGM